MRYKNIFVGVEMKFTKQYGEKYFCWTNKDKLARCGLEAPALCSMLGSITGKRILCLGSGSGEECNYLLSLGAKEVVGVDISKLFIKESKKKYKDIAFYVADMENLKFKDNSFDIVFSRLAMHYLKSWIRVLSESRRVLKKGGLFLFSTHNPVYWAGTKEETTEKTCRFLGYEKNKKTNKTQVYGDYLNIRKIIDFRSKDLKIVYWHRPFSSLIKDIIVSGFKIIDCCEPKPQSFVKKEDYGLWDKANKLPIFVIFKLQK